MYFILFLCLAAHRAQHTTIYLLQNCRSNLQIISYITEQNMPLFLSFSLIWFTMKLVMPFWVNILNSDFNCVSGFYYSHYSVYLFIYFSKMQLSAPIIQIFRGYMWSFQATNSLLYAFTHCKLNLHLLNVHSSKAWLGMYQELSKTLKWNELCTSLMASCI